MRCPFCAHLESKVIDSRLGAQGDVTRRRRECESCARRFTTYERVEEMLPMVVKKDGRRETFDRQKILGGLRRACEKRKVAESDLEALVGNIEQELGALGEKEIPSQAIGERVMHHLRELDDIAYVRFASVYRHFRDIQELQAELDRMTNDEPGTPISQKTGDAPPARLDSLPPVGTNGEH
jgi:transcriptional repressor NrdR